MTAPRSARFIRARICHGSSLREASLSVRDGTIAGLDLPAEHGIPDIDLRGLWLLPGAIDAHVHFDDPGFTHREDFASGSRAAAAGGVTTVVDMPCTSLPPVTDGASFDTKLAVVAPKAHVDFRLWGGARGNDFDPLRIETWFAELHDRGVRSIKTYLISGMDTFEDLTAQRLEQVLRAAARFGFVVGVHAEDKDMVAAATHAERARRSSEPASYARSRSAEAEAAGVQTCVRLAESTGARVHVVHLGCADGVALLRAARARGVPITAETCPHFLAFTGDDLDRMGGVLKTAPVVKSANDRDALWEALADGTLDFVATDHAPGQWPQEKRTGSIWTDYGGVPGVELMLPYLLSEGVGKDRLTLARAIELLCEGPARVHQLPNKGSLRPGADADLTVFDPDAVWEVRASELQTRQRYTPFEGWRFRGRVEATWVRGALVHDRQRGPVGEPAGRLVPSI